MNRRLVGGQSLLQVRWFGYDEDGDTWEPEGNLNGAKKALLNFSKTHKKDIDRERRIIEELKLAAAKSKRSGQKSFPPVNPTSF